MRRLCVCCGFDLIRPSVVCLALPFFPDLQMTCRVRVSPKKVQCVVCAMKQRVPIVLTARTAQGTQPLKAHHPSRARQPRNPDVQATLRHTHRRTLGRMDMQLTNKHIATCCVHTRLTPTCTQKGQPFYATPRCVCAHTPPDCLHAHAQICNYDEKACLSRWD